jgi:hypothetical protein
LAKFISTGNGSIDPNWNPNLFGSPAVVYALAASGTNLYVGGSFTSMGGLFRNSLAKVGAADPFIADTNWDAASDNLLSPMTETYALGLSGTRLYVEGSFGGPDQVNLVRVEATGTGLADTNWSPNSYSGTYQSSLQGALLPSGQDLYVGGQFQTIGGSYPGAPDASVRNGFAFLAVADAPTIVKTGSTNLIILPDSGDGLEIGYFQITAISGATLYQSDGVTQINAGDFITVAQGLAGLVFSGTNGVITVVSALSGSSCGAGTAATTLSRGSGIRHSNC